MKFRALLIAAAISAGLAGLAGCEPADPNRQAATPPPNTAPTPSRDRATGPTPPGDRATAPAPERSAGRTLDDAAITAKVKSALLAEKGVNGTAINVETMQGQVILTGRVPDQTQVERATQIASRVEGVKEVDNKLTVGTS